MEEQQEDHPWAAAPPEVLTIVITGLPSVADRFRFGAVCRRWHATERQLPQPKQLPWLALPIPSYPEASHCTFVSLPGESAYELPFPAGSGRARFCSSVPGGWLVVAHCKCGNLLFNAFTGATLPLPLPHQATVPYNGHPVHGTPDPDWNLSEAYIRKAVLSSPPDVSGSGCVVAALVNKHTLAVCHPDQSSWHRVEQPSVDVAEIDFEDIIFHNGKLCGIDTRELVYVFAVAGGAGGGELTVSRAREGPVGHALMWPRPERGVERDDLQRDVPLRFASRYLVESPGRLLLVLRYARADRAYSVIRRTYSFRVLEPVPSGEQQHLGWAELDGLDGELLFVCGSCSMSLTASDYFRGEADADCIYFTNDNFHVATAARRELRCRDIGRYSMRDRSVSFLDVQAPHNSRLPPTWLYVSD